MIDVSQNAEIPDSIPIKLQLLHFVKPGELHFLFGRLALNVSGTCVYCSWLVFDFVWHLF